MTQKITVTPSSQPKPHRLYIDCARGYAVLMVIASHLAYVFPGLPWPLKRVAASGWFGVQLFFLASSLTLLMSWHAEIARTGTANVPAFFVRRFCRVAPAYYAAGFLYFWITPPKSGFDLWHAIESASFISAWHPAWMPTLKDGWYVVPGGWSISVEFAFYAIFPLFAAVTKSLQRAVLVWGASILIGTMANLWTFHVLRTTYDETAVSNFLYFWFPNQACIFALGGVMFFVLRDVIGEDRLIVRLSTPLAVLSVAAFCTLTYLPLGHYLGDSPFMPADLAAALLLMVFVIALSGRSPLFVTKTIGRIGQVSFSAYLLHFTVLRLFVVFPGILHTQSTSVAAVAAFICGFLITVTITYCASWISFCLIEQPMIMCGKALIDRYRRRASNV